MERALLEAVIESILPHTIAVRLGGNDYGEQLLGENFSIFMKAFLSLKKRPDLEITTNGLLMTEAKAEFLIQADAHVRLSLEGCGYEYSRVRGKPWSEFMRSVEILKKAKDSRPENQSEITLYVSATADALDSIKELVERPLTGVDSIEIRHFYTHHYRQAMQSLFYNRELSNRFCQELRTLAEVSGIKLKVPNAFEFCHLNDNLDSFVNNETAIRLPCHKPFELVSILSDGSVYPCCATAPRLGVFTSETESIERIWNGVAYRYMRRIVNTKNARMDCKRCEDVQTEPGAFMIGFGSELVEEIHTKDVSTLIDKSRYLARRGFEKASGGIKRLEWLLLGKKYPF